MSLEATDNIYLTETDATLRLVLAHTYTGDIRLTVRESAPDTDEDLELLALRQRDFAESNTRLPGNDPDHLRIVPHGQIFAEGGDVTLHVGDDISTHQNSEIVADGRSTSSATSATSMPNFGTTMVLRGRIVADAVVTPGDPVGTYVPDIDGPDVPDQRVWQRRRRHVPVRRPERHRRRHRLGRRGLHLPRLEDARPWQSGSARRQRRRGPASSSTTCRTRTVTTGPTSTVDADADHTLTLDGQADTDYYDVYTLGSHGGDERNYVINVLDTGAENDGVDELTIFGLDRPTRPSTATSTGTTTQRAPNDDIFLLRAAQGIPTETADRLGLRRAAARQRRSATATLIAEQRADPTKSSASTTTRRSTAGCTVVRPRRQRRTSRRRQHRHHDARRRRRLRHLPDRPDLRHQARRQAEGDTAAATDVFPDSSPPRAAG